ncbi:hypothetical protein [uncultured Thiodictyon sp.]|uniref:hypothetical protein n=1 Tax=uncultured Thiodictyon sp. TaxID=1846217 RepID=UPI0025E083AF|nr:hypothetical protein [uncultured Thiodictyon sp.]
MTARLGLVRPADTPPVKLPEVLLALEQIRDRSMEAERRLAMLRALKDPVEAIQSARARRGAGLDGCAPSRTLSLEDSVYRSWCGNLQRLLIDLGHPRSVGQARFAIYREWVLRQLLKDLGRAADAAVRAGQRVMPGTWRSLHDLFLYLDGRDEVAGPAPAGPARFNPGNEYKRLLLLGALAEYQDLDQILPVIGPRLREWAGVSVLKRDVCVVGESALLRLDLTADGPPRRARPGDEQPYQGWVLEPAKPYTDALAAYPLCERQLTAAA